MNEEQNRAEREYIEMEAARIEMKSYHLTQEQVLEIASNLELDGLDRPVWVDGYVEFETKEALQLFVNAVLDQMLGEPVAEVVRNDSGQIFMTYGEGDPFDMSKNVGAKLYAPKEQS